jgi:hypothetical protein
VKRALYLAHSCEQALARGEPLHPALAAALAAAGGPRPGERGALGAALAGQIEAPLRQLGFDPLAARAAQVAPAEAAEVGRRLRALPDGRALARHALVPLGYVGLVLALQIMVAALTLDLILPVLVSTMAGSSVVLPWVVQIALALLRPLSAPVVAFPAALLALAAARLLRPLLARRMWEADGARLCSAAAALVGAGMEGPRALAALAGAVPQRRPLEEFLRDAGLGKGSLEGAAQSLAARARARAGRLRLSFWSGGMALAIVFGGCILACTYGAIFQITDVPFGWAR